MAITVGSTFTDNLLGTGTEGVATQIGSGTLVLYASGGSPPAGPNESPVGTILATFTFNNASSQGSPSGGSMTLSFSATTVTASGSGTADYFRILNSGSAALIQGAVGTSGADWNLSSTSITSGDNVSITGTPTISWVVSLCPTSWTGRRAFLLSSGKPIPLPRSGLWDMTPSGYHSCPPST